MQYDACVVDCSCLFHKCKSKENSVADISTRMIERIEKEIRKHVSSDGKLFLLFDPIPPNDLQFDKSFTYVGIRKKILPDYKANRTFSPFYSASMQALRKYYAYRGPSVVEIYSDEYEADDYVEWIIGQYDGKKVALVANDQDWARYLKDDESVHLIQSTFKKPYTKSDFRKEFGFNPTPAANALYKGLFGDKSDNISGAIFIKKAKFSVPIKTICLEAVKQVSFRNWSVSEMTRELSKQIKFDPEHHDNVEKMVSIFRGAEPRLNVMDKLNQNLAAIFSLCEDASKFATWGDERPELNRVLKESITGEKTPLSKRFGKIRL